MRVNRVRITVTPADEPYVFKSRVREMRTEVSDGEKKYSRIDYFHEDDSISVLEFLLEQAQHEFIKYIRERSKQNDSRVPETDSRNL